MFKATPNPPKSPGVKTIDPHTTDRALAPVILPDENPRMLSGNATTAPPRTAAQGLEDTLVNAGSILESAAATAYENADNLTGANRKVAMGVVHLIDMAQRLVDSAIEESSARNR